MCAIEGKEDSIKTFQIDSFGGNPAAYAASSFSIIGRSAAVDRIARRIGAWIHENDIDVVVENNCFSSCANHIFTAAKNKIIKADSTVAWHGSSQRHAYIIQRRGITFDDYLSEAYDTLNSRTGTTPSDDGRVRFIEGFKAHIAIYAIEEQEFLENIGVDVDVMVYGLLPQPWEIWSSSDSEGWTFSVEDMAKLGIDNVTYQGEGEYPDQNLAEERGLLIFDVPSGTSTTTEPSTPIHAPHLDCSLEPIADISIVGSTLFYRAGIDARTYREFLCAIKGKEDSIETVHIDSSGGTTSVGRKIGTWIHENDIDVIVENWCFSSCANYIFTAAKNKTLKANSVVGWHGSGQQTGYIIQRAGTTLHDHLSRSYDQFVMRRGTDPSEEDRMEFIEGFKDSTPIEVMEEQEFLEKIGVSVDVMVYGMLPEPWNVWSGSGTIGWTFSIEDMAKLGIENVTYDGEGTYPDRQAAQSRNLEIFRVP